jgi:hypothetical protein
MTEGEQQKTNTSPEETVRDIEEEARALYGHIFGAQQRGLQTIFYSCK